MGFEPTRAEHTGLAVQPLNLSGTSSRLWVSKVLQETNIKNLYKFSSRIKIIS